MNVSCPECRSVFRVDPAKLPAGSVRARCSVCGGVITVVANGAEREEFAPAGAPMGATSTPRSTPVAARTPMVPRDVTPATPVRAVTTAVPMPIPTPSSTPVAPRSPTPPVTSSGTPTRVAVTPPFAGQRRMTPPFAGPRRSPMPGPLDPPAARPVRPPVGPAVARPRPAATPAVSAPHPSARPESGPTPAAAPPPQVPAQVMPTPVGGAPHRVPINPFLANDPSAKARRLARALISDLIVYFPQKREEGLRDGTLGELFREEIKKSYEEFLEQVGRAVAEGTTHFVDALNDILADGKKVFRGPFTG